MPLRIASIAALVVLGGATLAFASAQPGNSRDARFRSTQIACGAERREVKQLLDDDAPNVHFGDEIDSTVRRMGQLKRPAETGHTRQPKERRVYRSGRPSTRSRRARRVQASSSVTRLRTTTTTSTSPFATRQGTRWSSSFPTKVARREHSTAGR